MNENFLAQKLWCAFLKTKMEKEMKVEVESKWILQNEGAKIKLNGIIGIIGQLSSKFFEEDLL